MSSVVKDQCNQYGLCGVHGVCNINDTVPCKCLKGFVPESPQNWSRVDWSDGCRRRVGLNCINGIGEAILCEGVSTTPPLLEHLNEHRTAELGQRCWPDRHDRDAVTDRAMLLMVSHSPLKHSTSGGIKRSAVEAKNTA
ncbi:hypothetical protein Sjap_002842 [Stephania japonica]|uniref:S-locus glycoprotein domain-containing protein n=1 Tax=Stephania japonica TaxID=461633 RepID=A0AAP0PSZ8_9MAGN